MASIVSAILFVLLSQSPAPAAQTASTCAVAEDPTYGYTTENAVQVGGGAMYVKAREQRYLDALRGPGGESIQYKRIAAMPQSPNSRTILDRYELTYSGLEQPITLYLDAYHFWTPRAPKGLVCGQAFNLQPILDGFRLPTACCGSQSNRDPRATSPLFRSAPTAHRRTG